jgi:hypothetical protein
MEKEFKFKVSLIPLIILGVLFRIILESRVGFLKHYVYFNTPLMDLRQLFEAINNYKITGSYFIDHNAIN